MIIVPCRTFDIERRLLSGYYEAPLGGLSPIAFRRYVLLCRAARKYRQDPFIVWSSLAHMRREGGLFVDELDQYQLATQELYDKGFIKDRPDWDTPARPDHNELLVLPNYQNGRIFPNTSVPREQARQLNGGYIQLPRDLIDRKRGWVFHQIIKEKPADVPSQFWAIIIKLYEYNNLLIHGGVDPLILRREKNELLIHSMFYEELYVERFLVEQCIEHLLSKGLMIWQSVFFRQTDVAGTVQFHYLRDRSRGGSLQVARLRYQPGKQYFDWMEDGCGSLF